MIRIFQFLYQFLPEHFGKSWTRLGKSWTSTMRYFQNQEYRFTISKSRVRVAEKTTTTTTTKQQKEYKHREFNAKMIIITSWVSPINFQTTVEISWNDSRVWHSMFFFSYSLRFSTCISVKDRLQISLLILIKLINFCSLWNQSFLTISGILEVN